MAAKMGLFRRGDAGNGATTAPHVGATKFVRPVADDVAYGRWLYERGYEIENCTTDAMVEGWLEAEGGN